METIDRDEVLARFRGAPDRLVDAGAGEVAVRSFGSGPDVLFVHGWPVSGATFRALVPHLAEHVTCHVVDLPGAGSSRFDRTTPITVHRHIETVRRLPDLLGLADLAVVGHDSGGLIARHALAADGRVRGWGLVDTEQDGRLTWRFRSILLARRLPGLATVLAQALGRPALRRRTVLLGDAFADRTLIDGEFDELFLQPIVRDPERREAAARLLASFDLDLVRRLPEVHRRMTAPVRLVWGERDPFFPVSRARAVLRTFPDASLEVIPGASLFCHEERPAEVARALLPVLRPAG